MAPAIERQWREKEQHLALAAVGHCRQEPRLARLHCRFGHISLIRRGQFVKIYSARPQIIAEFRSPCSMPSALDRPAVGIQCVPQLFSTPPFSARPASALQPPACSLERDAHGSPAASSSASSAAHAEDRDHVGKLSCELPRRMPLEGLVITANGAGTVVVMAPPWIRLSEIR